MNRRISIHNYTITKHLQLNWKRAISGWKPNSSSYLFIPSMIFFSCEAKSAKLSTASLL